MVYCLVALANLIKAHIRNRTANMSDFLKWLVVFLVFSPIFVVIGACALGYYSAISRPSDETISRFLAELKFPSNIFYCKYKYSVLAAMGSSPFRYIKEATLLEVLWGS